MYSLLKKEISNFFSSLIGYIAIIIFLLSTGCFIWVFHGDFNVLDSGYSNIDSLFIIAPWVFMFLIPAITMRSIAEEKKTGTIELLFTKPLVNLRIIFAKYLAGVIIVVLSLLPTLIYYISIYKLGNPVGNIDSGGTWGSFIGLLFLGCVFVSIGIFASSLTNNQITAFIVGMFLCFVCYIGFDFIGSLEFFGKIDNIIIALGINYHYISISRGVVDTRDLIYFLSSIILFLLFTKTVLESRKW